MYIHIHRCMLVITVFVTIEGRQRRQQQQKQIVEALPAGAISGAPLYIVSVAIGTN